jgi:transmembrane sensor
MDYSNFSVEDFLHDDAFLAWVKTGQQDAFWQKFMQENPAQAPSIAQAKLLIEAVSSLPAHNLNQVTEAELWAGIETQFNTKNTGVIKLKPRNNWLLQIAAACILLGLGTGWYWWAQSKNLKEDNVFAQEIAKAQRKEQPVQVFFNDSKQTKNHRLPDGSVVHLETGSSLSFLPASFDQQQREVLLVGEAFFEVKKNPQKPFVVYAKQTLTKVLGTSFRVRSLPGTKRVVVAVSTGKVAVTTTFDTQFKQAVVLSPNQQAIADVKAQTLTKTLVEQPRLLPQTDQVQLNFEFNNTPVAEVYAQLAKAYGVAIVFDEQQVKGCTVTAPLENESLYEKLDLICRVTRATYEVKEGQIIISSRGCW